MTTEKEIDLSPYNRNFEELTLHEEYFHAQIQLLRELVQLIDKVGRPERLNSLGILLYSLVSNGDAIDNLIHRAFIPEAYIIARSFLEKCVNFCYLNICDQYEYANYLDWTEQKLIRAIYTKQKAFKNVGSDLPIPDINSFAREINKIKKFSGKKGGEKFSWTNLSLYHRIKFLEDTVGIKTLGMYLAAMNVIYEDASENIHGTLYGATFHTAMLYGVEISEEDKTKRQLDLATNLYLFSGSLVHGICQVVSTKIQANHILKKSDENISKAQSQREALKKRDSG